MTTHSVPFLGTFLLDESFTGHFIMALLCSLPLFVLCSLLFHLDGTMQ